MESRPSELLQSFEQRLGYTFKNIEWLSLALTHSAKQGENNQRLEFLGDAILGAVVSRKLFEEHPDWDEGDLSVGRTALVCKDHLASVALHLSLGDALIVRKEVAKSGPVHAMPSVLADALEAVMGAVFMDGGYDAVFKVACALIVQHEQVGIDHLRVQSQDALPIKDPKTRLQEWLQAKGCALPTYHLVRTEGPPNDCIFYAECHLIQPHVVAQGEGRSRKSAEQAAAAEVLQQLLKDTHS